MAYVIRTFGDPVLRSEAAPITDVDGKLVRLVDDMFTTLHDNGLGIALRRPRSASRSRSSCGTWTVSGRSSSTRRSSNPMVSGSTTRGACRFPVLYVLEMLRPKTVLMRGIDIDGEIIEREADELEARMFQHELDHLNGVLMFDRMQPDQRKQAIAEFRRLERQAAAPPSAARPESRLRRLRLK